MTHKNKVVQKVKTVINERNEFIKKHPTSTGPTFLELDVLKRFVKKFHLKKNR